MPGICPTAMRTDLSYTRDYILIANFIGENQSLSLVLHRSAVLNKRLSPTPLCHNSRSKMLQYAHKSLELNWSGPTTHVPRRANILVLLALVMSMPDFKFLIPRVLKYSTRNGPHPLRPPHCSQFQALQTNKGKLGFNACYWQSCQSNSGTLNK